jgi:hypothetical protein
MPSFCLLLGGLVLAANWIGGDLGTGLRSSALFVVLAAVFLFARRSETLQGLGGPGRDERWAMIDLRATAFAGGAVIVVVAGAWLWELSQGEDGNPYTWIMATGGLAYIVAVVVARLRS